MTPDDVHIRLATPDDADAIRDIWLACLREGVWEGIDEAFLRRQAEDLRAEPAATFVAKVDGVIVGTISSRFNDLAVTPAFRRRGVGTALVAASLEPVRADGDPYLLLYIPGGGDPPRPTPARLFAEARGFTYRATLTHMRLDGLGDVPEPAFPAGLAVRPFYPTVDGFARYVALMNATFADHPTAASWDPAAVARAYAAPGFDHAGIASVAEADDPDRPLAFVRTVVAEDDAGDRFGEIRLVGVEPAIRGRGVGRALVRWSIARFRDLGLDRAELSVVASNDTALALYRSEGFRTVVEWPQWSLDVGEGPAD